MAAYFVAGTVGRHDQFQLVQPRLAECEHSFHHQGRAAVVGLVGLVILIGQLVFFHLAGGNGLAQPPVEVEAVIAEPYLIIIVKLSRQSRELVHFLADVIDGAQVVDACVERTGFFSKPPAFPCIEEFVLQVGLQADAQWGYAVLRRDAYHTT